MLSVTRTLLSNLRLTPVTAAAQQQLHTSATLDRARKGTRERKRKVMLANRRKREERLRKNPPPLPKVLVKMLYERYGIVNGKPWPMRAVEDDKQFPSDDTYRMWTHCYARYPFERALHELRCHYHPSMLNRPDDPVYARVELNMKAVKTDKYLDDFSKMIPVKHPFGTYAAIKNVCAFVPTEEDAEKAKESGAFLAGGEELIKEIVKGRVDLTEIDHFVCHEDLFVQMKTVAGMLRDKTPKVSEGTVGSDVAKMITIFRSGMIINVSKPVPSLIVAKEPDFGSCEVPIGYLSQDANELKDNLDLLLESLMENKPKRDKGGWITRVTLLLEDGSAHAKFSIIHDLIDDAKLKEHLDNIEKENKARQST